LPLDSLECFAKISIEIYIESRHPQDMDEKVTITDIAQRSGVSVATVSLVLNNRPGVAKDTRARVLEAAEALGYPLKPTQSAGKPENLTTVGMIVKSDSEFPPYANPFYSRIIAGIDEVCRRNGINLLFATMPVDANNHPLEVPQILNSDGVDGLLMVGTFVDKTLLSISGRRTPPIVLVDSYSETDSYDSVVSDNFQAAYSLVEYLIRKGHTQIGMVGGRPDSYPSIRQRRNGYQRSLKDHGIRDLFLADCNVNESSHGRDEAECLLRSNPQLTAVFGVNDDTAITVMSVAQSLGLQIPRDLSVVGYDDIYAAATCNPPLTTMRVDTVAMGRAAVHLLAMRLTNLDMARMTLTVHPTLVERQSVAAPKSGKPEKS
jgi:LacI family transcriptional regulator